MTNYEDVPTEELEQLTERWKRKALGSSSRGKRRVYRSMKAELESREGSGSRSDTEATETASMADIGKPGSSDNAFGEFDHDELSAARERYGEAADEYGGPWNDVLASLDAELESREDTTVAELSVATSSGGIHSEEPTVVSGTVISGGDKTRGSSKTTKLWGNDALAEAADSLEGQPVVLNHENQDVRQVVGSVTDSHFDYRTGDVKFEAEIDDPEIAEKIERGRVDVSARIRHAPVEELTETDDGTLRITDRGDILAFDNLSVVTHGAAPSNEIRAGSGL